MPDEVSPITAEESDSARILLRDFLPPIRKGYLRVGPKKVVVTDRFTTFDDALRNMEVRDDDTWVMSYPKTGTTWTQEMVWCIANNLDFKGAQQNIVERFPFLEVSAMAHFEECSGLPTRLLDSVQFISQLESPRFIKTHLPWSLLPLQLRTGVKKPKIVYVTRNAQDTCLSYFHHCRLLEGYTGTFEDFCQLFLDDLVIASPFWSHVLSGWEHRDQDNVMFLEFEDMKKDLPSVIRRTAKFLGKELNEEQVSTLARHLSFDSMKINKAVNYEELKIETNTLLGIGSEEGTFMRSGVTGEGKEKMSSDIRRKFEAWTKRNLLGTDFPVRE